MFENFLNKIKSNPAESKIYHLSPEAIDKLKEKAIKDAEIEREAREARLAKEVMDHEEADRVRKLLQQEEFLRKGPYVINDEDYEKSKKLVGKI